MTTQTVRLVMNLCVVAVYHVVLYSIIVVFVLCTMLAMLLVL